MSVRILWVICLLCGALAGCATAPVGCSGQACERPDSSDRALVIWWPEDMRTGLNDTHQPVDFSIVPIRD